MYTYYCKYNAFLILNINILLINRKTFVSNGNSNENKNIIQIDTIPKDISKYNKPKGTMTWNEYILDILEYFGGRAKTDEIRNIVHNSNSDMSLDEARKQTSKQLSKMISNNVLDVEKGLSKKQGYTYILKEKPTI